MDSHEYYRTRANQIVSMGPEAYPHKWSVTTTLPEFRAKYESLTAGETVEEEVSVAGRV